MPKLIVTENGRQAAYDVSDAGLTIGRETDNDVVLQEARCSRRHARLTRVAAGWLLADIGSSNGTFVDGRRITQLPIADGARFMIGTTELRFEDPEPPPPAFTAEVSDEVAAAATIIEEGAELGDDFAAGMDGSELGFTDDSGVAEKPPGLDESFSFLDAVEPESGLHPGLQAVSPEEALAMEAELEDEAPRAKQPSSRRAAPTGKAGSARAAPTSARRAATPESGRRAPASDRAAPAERPAAGRGPAAPRFTVVRGPQQGADLMLGPGDSFFIGSSPNSDVVLEDPSVAPIHAALRRDGLTFYVAPSGASSGTHLNGKFLVSEQKLEHDAVLRVGDCALKFQLWGEPRPAGSDKKRTGLFGRLRRKE